MDNDNKELQAAIEKQVCKNNVKAVGGWLAPHRLEMTTQEAAKDYALILSSVPRLLQSWQDNNKLLKELIFLCVGLRKLSDALTTDLDGVKNSQVVIQAKQDILAAIERLADKGVSVDEMELEIAVSTDLERKEDKTESTESQSESRRLIQGGLDARATGIIESLGGLGLSTDLKQELEEALKSISETRHSTYEKSESAVVMKFNSGTVQPGPKLLEQFEAKLNEYNNRLSGLEQLEVPAQLKRLMNQNITKNERIFFYSFSVIVAIYIVLDILNIIPGG